jgi:chemotaxis regulatin CheY-phosphate phosphatase CheZ
MADEDRADLLPLDHDSEEANLGEVKQATKNLVDALQRLAKAKARVARDLSEDAHDNIDRLVQNTRTKANRAINEVGGLDNRLGRAAKAAWDVLSAKDQPEDPPA